MALSIVWYVFTNIWIGWGFWLFQLSLATTNLMTFGLLDTIFPHLYMNTQSFNRIMFTDYNWNYFNPNNVIFSGDTSFFAEELVEVVAEGKGWWEGPVWYQTDQALFYSDCINDRIYKWTQSDGYQVFLERSGGYLLNDNNLGDMKMDYEKRHMPGSNGLAIKDGYIYIC